VGDPSAKQSIEDLCHEGVPVYSANNDRQAGRMRLLEYFQSTEDAPHPFSLNDSGDRFNRQKWARIYITSDCKELIRELKFFRWKESSGIEGEKEKTEGEDHACDCLRYLVFTRPSPFKLRKQYQTGSFMSEFNKIKRHKRMSGTRL